MSGPLRPRRISLPELVAGLGGLALAIAIVWASFRLPEFPVRFAGPAFYPRLLAVVLAAISGGLIFFSLKGAAPSPGTESPEASGGERGRGWRVLSAITVSFVYYLALPIAGFALATAVYFAFLMFLMQSKKQVLKTVLWSVVSTALIYLVFAMVLKASLPVGQIFR